jgi:hypothetical protein
VCVGYVQLRLGAARRHRKSKGASAILLNAPISRILDLAFSSKRTICTPSDLFVVRDDRTRDDGDMELSDTVAGMKVRCARFVNGCIVRRPMSREMGLHIMFGVGHGVVASDGR